MIFEDFFMYWTREKMDMIMQRAEMKELPAALGFCHLIHNLELYS